MRGLRTLSRTRVRVSAVRVGLWALAGAVGGVLVVVWLDVLTALPAAARVGGLIGVAGLVLVLFGWTALTERRRLRHARLARDVDELAGTGGQVVVGLDLAEEGSGVRGQGSGFLAASQRRARESGQWSGVRGQASDAALTQGLALAAVGRAGEIVEGFAARRIEPLRRAARAGEALVALVAFIGLLALVFPRAARIEVARLLHPWADRPAYSRYIFAIEPGNTRVTYGDGLAVRATVSGVPVDRLDLIVRQEGGSEATVPMFEDRDRSWRAQLTDITAPLDYWAQAAGGRSDRYRIDVALTPKFESLAVRIAPPKYTNLPATEGGMPQGGITGLPGTEVRITATSNRPLSKGLLEVKPDTGAASTLAVTPAADNAKTVTWTFPLERAGQLSLTLIDESGTRSAAPVTAPVILLKDRRPLVRIIQPRAQSYATPDVALPVEVEGDDDYGVISMSLYRSLNASRHLALQFDLSVAGKWGQAPFSERTPKMEPVPIFPPRVTRGETLPLKAYGLQPGDVITLFARAEDSDPAGAKGAESGVVQVTIISRELYEEMVRARKTIADVEAKYRAAARRMERLAAQGEEARKAAEKEKGDRLSDEMRKRLNDWAKALDEAAERTRKAAEQDPAFALEKDLAKSLKEAAERMRRAAEQAREAAGELTPDEMRRALDQALKDLQGGRDDFQRQVMAPFNRFARALDLLEMQQRFVELYQAQTDLAQRMNDLKDLGLEDDPPMRARMRDLREEQEALAGQLDMILEEITKRAQALPPDPDLEMLRESAQAFAEGVGRSRAAPAMRGSAEHLGGLRGQQAHGAAAEAAAVLKAFIKECQGGAAGAGQACQLAFGPTLATAAALTRDQALAALGLKPGSTGAGSGQGGYSMRTPTLQNVGLYGPMTPALVGAGEGDEDVTAEAFALERAGGDLAGQLPPGRRGAAAIEGVPIQSVPPQHRDRWRAYARRIAEEAARGAVIEEEQP